MSEPIEPLQPSAAPQPVDPAVPALEARLRVPLPDATLALAALTHKSFVNEHRGEALSDNERLEFLGDAVIDLAVSHRLMERFPGAREGELSKIRAAVVDEAGLARIARELDLGALLRLGRGEELTGGRQKSSLLADALEAVIAAVYLGGGLTPVLTIVDRFLGEAFAQARLGTLDRDYKTQFQELAQSRMRLTPRYRVVAEHGPDHSKTFEVELELRGEVVGRGSGRSKKDAEQAAAKIALDQLNGKPEAAAPQDACPGAAEEPSPGLPPPPGGTPEPELAAVALRAEPEPAADAGEPEPVAERADEVAADPAAVADEPATEPRERKRAKRTRVAAAARGSRRKRPAVKKPKKKAAARAKPKAAARARKK